MIASATLSAPVSSSCADQEKPVRRSLMVTTDPLWFLPMMVSPSKSPKRVFLSTTGGLLSMVSILVLQSSLSFPSPFASQMHVHGAPFLFVFPNHLIDCFVAYSVDAPDLAVVLYLLRVPVHAQFRDNGFMHFLRHPMVSGSRQLPIIASFLC